MPDGRSFLQPLRALAAHRALLLALVALWLLKAAVPLFAVGAAQQRGVTLAEVCSVYGVRTASVADEPPSSPPSAPQVGHGSDAFCGLVPALAAALLGTLPQPPARAQAVTAAPAVPARVVELPVDRPLAWLVARTHAPPFPA